VDQVKLRYSDYLFQAQDEVLVDNLIVAFAKGLEVVWRAEHESDRKIPAWSVGAVLDKVSAVLNTHWSQEYIYKQTQEYKELCFLKTLSQFLKLDTVAIQKLEMLYKHLMSKEINIIEQKFEKKDKVIDLIQFKKDKKPNAVFKKNITDYLDSIFYEKHFRIFGDILKNKTSFVLANFFSNDEIIKLIERVNSQRDPHLNS
jgi:hypothetical protein